jgi:UDPglucose 6-dehydrogenase
MGLGDEVMNICVQGLWHLGTVTAACLASLGHSVTGLDFDLGTIGKLKKGIPPLYEPGLEKLVQSGLASGYLSFTSQADEALQGTELLWIAYDTPVDVDDNADVDYVFAQIEKVLFNVPAGATILISSQMPAGSVKRLEAIAKDRFPEKEVGFACSPENLRLGKALETFLRPERIIVGTRFSRDREKLERLLRSITDRIEWMSVESAEMTKHAINAFLATSVAYINEIASICEVVGADAKEVERGLRTESRIGPKAYLSPGGPFAGGTLARDISFLNIVSAQKGVITPLLSSIKASNLQHKHWVMRKLRSLFPNLSQATIAVWGLTYKAGTDTLRGSPAIELCQWLLDQGAKVCVHDPVVKELPRGWEAKVITSDDPVAVLKDAQALVISTEWPQYREIPAERIANMAPGLAVLDANRFLSSLGEDPRLRYMAVGTPNLS